MASVSVVMSTCNGAKYVVPQIDSILNQELVDVRIAIRDDGSSNNTVKLITSLNDPRITILDTVGGEI